MAVRTLKNLLLLLSAASQFYQLVVYRALYVTLSFSIRQNTDCCMLAIMLPIRTRVSQHFCRTL